MPWNSVLKLFLLKKLLAGPLNNVRDPLKNARTQTLSWKRLNFKVANNLFNFIYISL